MSQIKTINAASFREWFEKNVSKEDCEYICDEAADSFLYEDFGSEADFYDLFEEEIWVIVLEGERSLADVFDDWALGCLCWFRYAMVNEAANRLARERPKSIAA